MKVFAGTYQGNVFVLSGSPTDLRIRLSKNVSENSLRSLTLSEDQLLVGGYDQELRAVDYVSGNENKESKESKGVINCIRNVSEKLAVLGLDNGTIRFWDKTSWTSRKDLKQHKKSVTDIKIDKKGLMMVSVGGKEMIFWNISTMKSLYHFRYDYDIEHVLLVDSFQYLFVLGDRTIRQINTDDNSEMFKIEVDSKIQCGLVFENYLIVATEKGQIKVWNHGKYLYNLSFKAHEARIKDIKVAAIDDADFLITADSNGQIRVWDILEFLKGVDSISQDYKLEGLKPLCSVQIKQRVICIDVQGTPKQTEVEKKEEEVQEQVDQQEEPQVQNAEKKKNKKKQINKQKQQNVKIGKNKKQH